jgi:hypothetical protein
MDRWIKATRVLASATAVLRRAVRAAVVPKEAVLLPVRLQMVVKQTANRMGYPVRFNSYLSLVRSALFWRSRRGVAWAAFRNALHISRRRRTFCKVLLRVSGWLGVAAIAADQQTG